MLKIGLTGGIGSGKSTVSRLFAKLNVPIIDADVTAHRLVQPGQPALVEIRRVFGDKIVMPNGQLDRAALRTLVFADPEQKKKLESILHPLIRAELRSEAENRTEPYCILAIPLLFETGMQQWVDRVLVVDCPVEIQIERVKKRDHLEDATIHAIIATQVSRETRTAGADDLIDNSGADSHLAEQVKKLHNLYLSLSAR